MSDGAILRLKDSNNNFYTPIETILCADYGGLHGLVIRMCAPVGYLSNQYLQPCKICRVITLHRASIANIWLPVCHNGTDCFSVFCLLVFLGFA